MMKVFANNLKKIMKEKKITAREIAEKLEVSRGTVTHWSNGIRTPSATKAEELARVLGVKVSDLYGESLPDLPEIDPSSIVVAEIVSVRAAAGEGANIQSVDTVESRRALIDARFFKTPPGPDLKAMQIDGYSMIPILYPDSWVLYRETDRFATDGLYIINYGDELMVKLLQINLETGRLEVISSNPQYKSWSIDPDDQSVFRIVGRVLRCIV